MSLSRLALTALVSVHAAGFPRYQNEYRTDKSARNLLSTAYWKAV